LSVSFESLWLLFTDRPVLSDGKHATQLLAESERIDLDAGIKKFDFEGRVFDGTLLTDELIHPRLSNFARAVGVGIGSVIASGRAAIQTESEANGRTVVSRTRTMWRSRL